MHSLEYFIFCGGGGGGGFLKKSENHKPVIDEYEQCMYSESRVIIV